MRLAQIRWSRYASIPADMIFVGVLLSLLIAQKEKKWLISLGKISLIIFFVKDILDLFARKFIDAGMATSTLRNIMMLLLIPYIALYIGLFFTGPGRLRICFRLLAGFTLFGLAWSLFMQVLFILHSPFSHIVVITYPIVFLLEYIPLFVGIAISAKQEHISQEEELLANFPEMQGADLR